MNGRTKDNGRNRVEDVTIVQVAAAAGVSPASVSRVLSGNRRVTAGVQQAVREACERLGYRPNQIARSLRRRTSEAIGVVVPSIVNPFFPSLIAAVERRLQGADQGVFLADSRNDPRLEAQRIAKLLERQVDGLLVIACELLESEPSLAAAVAAVPVVMIDRFLPGIEADFVGIDNETAIDLVVDHVRALGRRRLAFVGAAESSPDGCQRLHAFRRNVAAADASAPLRMLLGEYSIEFGFAATAELLTTGAPPDAVICANDLIAIGVVQCFRTHGVRVPEDVAVTGFDDVGFAAVCEPTLTTIRQPVQRIGERAVDLLLSRLNGDAAPLEHVLLPPQLVVRASTVSGTCPLGLGRTEKGLSA